MYLQTNFRITVMKKTSYDLERNPDQVRDKENEVNTLMAMNVGLQTIGDCKFQRQIIHYQRWIKTKEARFFVEAAAHARWGRY